MDCLRSDIIPKLRRFDVLLWNWRHYVPSEVLVARHVLAAAESMGLKVFPDSKTFYTFDNKVAQKYQLEALGAPLVPTHIFLDKQAALNWAADASYPKVFKLSRGAGASNVRLVRSHADAKKLICRAFHKGFLPCSGRIGSTISKAVNPRTRSVQEFIRKARQFRKLAGSVMAQNRLLGRDIGYCYFQDFIPDNTHDTRVTVIGNRAFAFRREVRPHDFRASGSGLIDYDPDAIDRRCLEIAFETAAKADLQSVAFDFVHAADGTPMILEMSYSYLADAVYRCPGFWDRTLRWHDVSLWPQDAILEDLLER